MRLKLYSYYNTMAMLPVKIQEFGLNKATGLRKGAVEGVVLVSDSPRVSNMVYMVSSTVDLSLAGTKQAQEKTPKDYTENFYHHLGPSLTFRNSFIFIFFVNTVYCPKNL